MSTEGGPRTRLIGVLGGTSWPSTMLPYQMLNEDVQRRLGGHHSARILLYSLNYHAIKSRYWDRWDEIPPLLKAEIETLLSWQPDCWMLANNTLHKAYDAIAHEIADVPFFHGVHLTRDHLVERGIGTALLLGTRFTMEDGFFAAPLEAAGVRIIVPDEGERAEVQAMQSRLSKGENDPVFREAFRRLLARYEKAGCEAVITACTELPLAIDGRSTPMEVVDPLVLQCRACVDFALAG